MCFGFEIEFDYLEVNDTQSNTFDSTVFAYDRNRIRVLFLFDSTVNDVRVVWKRIEVCVYESKLDS